jgi:hypothetical protein
LSPIFQRSVSEEYLPIVTTVKVTEVKNGKQLCLKNLTATQVLVVDKNKMPLAIYEKIKDEQYACKKGL